MRQHHMLSSIAPDATGLHLDAFELFSVFAANKLLPKSLHADVDAEADAKTWALFCFCLWTRSELRTASYYAKRLQGDGITAWISRDDQEDNFVEWLTNTLNDWKAATSVVDMEFDLTNETVKIWFDNSEEKTFYNRGKAHANVESMTRKISNNLSATSGAAVLWNMAGFFCGHVRQIHEDESHPRGEVVALQLRGNNYKA